jgi:GDP-4-dehydro-6-deoxy-D-mannose reductase
MNKILITGFSGFVSQHFLLGLEEGGVDAEVLGVDRTAPEFHFGGFRHVRCAFRKLDLLDQAAVGDAIFNFQPSWVLHLASYSSVGFSWHKPVESFTNNTNVLLNLLDQVRSINLRCRILSVGSSEEYGNVAADQLPLREDTPLKPLSPYAVARVAQEMLSSVYVHGYGLDIVMTRSFNHIGAFQRDTFVVPSFARQLCAIRHKGAPPKLVTGDRSVVRDFVDVRDVVRAYLGLFVGGKAGEIYNVCSGHGVSIQEVIDLMQGQLGLAVALETDQRLVRPNDNRIVVGSREKIRDAIGWEPEIPLTESLATILDWWRQQ